MKRTDILPVDPVFALLVAAGIGATGLASTAHAAVHLSITQPGGMPGLPVVTGVQRSNQNTVVTWDGPSGYYRLLQRAGLGDPQWRQIGTPTFSRTATVASTNEVSFYRVSGPLPNYAGSQVCVSCHDSVHHSVTDTAHSHAFESLKKIGQHTNPQCLPCHTVGFNLPSGFVDEATTPHLAGVQCENCHGPAGNHADNDADITVRPRRELASEACGGCHSTPHAPIFQEWKTSGHAIVTEDMEPADRIGRCGRCHSGSSRLNQLDGKALPSGDANVPITCGVCHSPHGEQTWTNVLTQAVYTNQLRANLVSTNDYFLTTTADVASTVNPQINLCAQCHNHRGASYESGSRPPHHSPQYNMLLGTVGELPTNAAPVRVAAHARDIDTQCVGCHMQKVAYVSDAQPAVTGHSFKVERYDICQNCHSLPKEVGEFMHDLVTNRIQQVQGILDQWALTKAPESIRKYGRLAWEYDIAGSLSSPDGTKRGPVSSTNASLDEQKYVPKAIKKARFNLYIVLHDGSYGVHNPFYTIALLDAALDWAWEALNE